jgi:hypothetical protein
MDLAAVVQSSLFRDRDGRQIMAQAHLSAAFARCQAGPQAAPPIAGEMMFAFGRLKRSELPAVLSGCSQAQALQRSIVVFREQGDRDVSGFVMTP